MANKGVVLQSDYSFNAAAKTITFSAAYTGLSLADVMYITNVKSGSITTIYDPNPSNPKGGSLSGLVLTLDFDTTLMSNSDPLQIIIGKSDLSVGTVTISGAGLATSAKQDTGNTSIASIDTKTPALGQALAAASVPIVLTAAQLSTLTPPSAITGFATESTLATRLSESDFDSKTGSLIETAPVSDTASSGLNGRLQRIAQRISSLITALGSPFQAGGSIGNTAFGVNNASGASAVNIQDGGNSITVDGTVTANTGLSQPLTDTQLRASVVPVSLSATIANAGTNLNTSALALETGGNLASIKAKTDNIPALGQALAAASTPVVLTAIQQTALTPPAAITGFNLESTQTLVKTNTDNLDVLLSTRLKPADTLAAVTSITNVVHVDDNAGSLTVDNTNLDTPLSTLNTSVNTLLKPASTLAAVTSITNVVHIDDNGGSLTIDATSLPLPTLASTSTKQSDGSQKTQIVDSGGNVIDSLSSGGYDNLLVAQGGTNFIVSTVNSTVAQLAASATFTGTVENVFSQQSYSILVVSDQNGTLTIKQYIDAGGTQLISSLVFSITASTPFARSGVLNGNYVNITFQNTGGSTTTTLRIDTAYGTIPSATQLNNAPVSINEVNGTALTLGQKTMANSLPIVVASDQTAIPVSFASASVLFRGRSSSFRSLGLAGTAGQKLMAIHNATGSSVTVQVQSILVNLMVTVVKAVTVAPPQVRIWKFTAVPTNGTAVTKNKIGGTSTSNASVTLWNGSSADDTNSGTALTVTLPAGTILDTQFAPRIITAVGEINNKIMSFEYVNGGGITLAPLEGLCVFLDYTLATQNPVTDKWVASIEWTEV